MEGVLRNNNRILNAKNMINGIVASREQYATFHRSHEDELVSDLCRHGIAEQGGWQEMTMQSALDKAVGAKNGASRLGAKGSGEWSTVDGYVGGLGVVC
jgi:hypothetical protein